MAHHFVSVVMAPIFLMPSGGFAHAAQLLDLAQVDDHFGPLDAASNQSKLSRPPASTQAGAVARLQGWRVIDGRRPKSSNAGTTPWMTAICAPL